MQNEQLTTRPKLSFSRTGKVCDLSPIDAAFVKLYFYNLLNQAGCNNTAVKFATVYEAEQSVAPMLKRIVKNLTPEELNFLIDRIEVIM